MRIGIAITSLHGGGAELIARQWADELTRRGHQVAVYLYEPGALTGAKDPTGLLNRAIEVRAFGPRGRIRRLLGLPIWLRRSAAADDLDVLITMLSFTNLAAIAAWKLGRRPRCRLLISERNSPSAYLPIRGRGAHWQARVARIAYRWSDGAVAVSHPVAGDLVGGYGLRPNRVFVVPNAVQVTAPTPAPAPRRSTTVVFVGRLVPQKRPERLVAVLAELASRPEAGEVRGIVIGAGPLNAPLSQAAADAGISLEMLGWQEPWSTAALNAGADVLLLPSDVEGFGNVLVEAAAAGLPSVAASTALGVADAIVPGITGEFALTSAPEDLADALLLAAEIDVRGAHVDRWLARFSSQRSADALLRAIEITRDQHEAPDAP